MYTSCDFVEYTGKLSWQYALFPANFVSLIALAGLPEPPFLAGAGAVFFGPAPAPTPTINILFLRDPTYEYKYDYDYDYDYLTKTT